MIRTVASAPPLYLPLLVAATKRLDPEAIVSWPVSTRVNKPENNDEEPLERVEAAAGGACSRGR